MGEPRPKDGHLGLIPGPGLRDQQQQAQEQRERDQDSWRSTSMSPMTISGCHTGPAQHCDGVIADLTGEWCG